jgi:transcriptional regulator
MYVPEPFQVPDDAELHRFMEEYDFATVVSPFRDGLISTHAPVVVTRDSARFTIGGHFARENPHREATETSAESLVIFHGPHGYVSPSWYVNTPAVPTWNYGVVHAYGLLRIREDREFIDAVLHALVRRHEAARLAPWRMEDLPPEFLDQMASRIVGFELLVRKVEGKFKLGQNRPAEDRAATIQGLEKEASCGALALAEFMRSRRHDGSTK